MTPMPVFVIKAKDHLSLGTIRHYRDLCLQNGLFNQAQEVEAAIHEIEQWRLAHPDECKWPDHAHVPAEDLS